MPDDGQDNLLLTRKRTAARLNIGLTWLDATRKTDTERIGRGEPPKGPRWRVYPFGVRYHIADLAEWVAEHGIDCGTMESKRRAPAEDAGAP